MWVKSWIPDSEVLSAKPPIGGMDRNNIKLYDLIFSYWVFIKKKSTFHLLWNVEEKTHDKFGFQHFN